MSGNSPKSILKRNSSTKKNRRIRFINRNNVAPNLPTPPHVTGFNRTNPFSLAEGWQTHTERAAAAANARIQRIIEKRRGMYVEPYKYQDPHFVYPLESRINVALAASNVAKMNRAAMALEKLRNTPGVNHVAINVKPATRRRTRRHRN
jgi:hypothetical protein